jgi:predicted Zn-dependent protease
VSGGGRLREADELLEAGQIDAACELYLEARQAPETAAPALVGLARAALISGDEDKALGFLDEALALDKRSAPALTLRGLLHERQDERSSALELYHRAVEADPDAVDTRVYFGRALLEEGKLSAAEVQMQAAVHLRPDDPLGYYLLGCVFLSGGRRADAAMRFTRAIELDPLYGDVYEALGQLLLDMGRRDEAIRVLRTGVQRLDEESAYGCLRLLVPAASSAEDFAAAREFLMERLAVQEEAQALCSRLAHRAVELGMLEEAEAIVGALGERCPQFANAALERGVVLDRQGRREEAVEALRQAWALDRGAWETACRLGRLLLEGGVQAQQEEGLELLKRATELAGNDPRPVFMLAQGYLKAGRPDRARRAALKVARHPDATEEMAEQARDLLRRLPVPGPQ